MSGLTPCSTCHRHIEIPHGPSGLERESAVCPFCGARVRFTFAPPVAAWSLALGLVAAACSENESNDDDTTVGSTTEAGPTSGPGATSTSQGASVTDTLDAGGEEYAGPSSDGTSSWESSPWETTGALESESGSSESEESSTGESGTGESSSSSSGSTDDDG